MTDFNFDSIHFGRKFNGKRVISETSGGGANHIFKEWGARYKR